MISNIYPMSLFSKPLHESLYFSMHLRDVPGAEAKLQCASEKSRWMWMQKNTPVPRLNKGFSCQ